MPRRLHSSMKCVAFSADSENSTPLLATMPTRNAVQPREAGDERRAVALLELVEARAVDQPRDDLAHVVRLARVGVDDAVDLARVVRADPRARSTSAGSRLRRVERRDDRPRQMQRVLVVFGEVVGDAGEPRVDVGAAELFGRDFLAGRRLHERRPAEEDRARCP